MKIIPLQIDKPLKIPLHKNRAYIDNLKDDIVKSHNKKVRDSIPDL